MADFAHAVAPPERPHWPGAGRAALLFVGIPLTAALVLAAAPLSEPPPPSALPARAVRSAAEAGVAPSPAPRAPERDCDEVTRILAPGWPRPVLRTVAAPRPPAPPRPARAAPMVAAAPAVAAVVAGDIERVPVQSP
jgi:hypothetical protein